MGDLVMEDLRMDSTNVISRMHVGVVGNFCVFEVILELSPASRGLLTLDGQDLLF